MGVLEQAWMGGVMWIDVQGTAALNTSALFLAPCPRDFFCYQKMCVCFSPPECQSFFCLLRSPFMYIHIVCYIGDPLFNESVTESITSEML